MEILDLVQGSPEWIAHRLNHFNASEAPFIMGKSNKTSRDELLYMKHFNAEKEFSDFVQKHVLDKGHQAEEAARPFIEEQFGEDLSPITGKNGPYSASFDGINFDLTRAWEHKIYNKELFALVSDGKFPDDHIWQMEGQFLVCDTLEEIIFTVSDGTPDNMVSLIYKSDPKKQKKLIKAWDLFKKDLDEYEPPEKIEKVVGAKPDNLPAVVFEVSGTLVKSGNLADYRAQINELIEKVSGELVTDQDFADADQVAKAFETQEKKLEEVKERAYSQFTSLFEFTKEIDSIKATMAQCRIPLAKRVKTEKDTRKQALINKAQEQLFDHFNALSVEIEGMQVAESIKNDAEAALVLAVKGKKNLESMREALNQVVADYRLKGDDDIEVCKQNLNLMKATKEKHPTITHFISGHEFDSLIHKAPEDFEAQLNSKVLKMKEAMEEEKQRAEEKLKQEAEQKAKEEAEQQAELEATAPEEDLMEMDQKDEQKPAAVEQGDAFADENTDVEALIAAADYLKQLVLPEMKTARGQQIVQNARKALDNTAEKLVAASKTI